jgi:UDP-N-acetylglucosamine 4,6-dehydratase/5-epimerase
MPEQKNPLSATLRNMYDMGTSLYSNKTILLTGGAGSVGSQLVRALLSASPRSIVLLDNNEGALYDLEQDLRSNKVSFVIADVRDKERIEPFFDGVDFVFHLAALKNVPMCEYNPYEAVKTNIIGTQNLIEVCLRHHVQKVIFTSTGKAVKPTTAYGASKLFAERLLSIANTAEAYSGTVFASVRFGNVLGSRGSVFALFRRQIEAGGPVTITHEEMVRPNILMSHALKMISNACEKAKGGEIFIFKMKAMRITEVADVFIQVLAPKYGHEPDSISTEIIGIKPGEKIREELMTESEQRRAYETEDMLIIAPEMEKLSHVQTYYRDLAARGDLKPFTPREPVFLTRAEIEEILHYLNYV